MKFIAVLALSTAIVSPAFADEAEDGKDIVVLANGFEQPRDQTGAAITVIDRERLNRLQVQTIGDALRTLPGVTVAKRATVGGQTSVFVRGGNSSQTLVLIDGVRANDVSSPNAAFDFGPTLAANFDRIEVLRGPNSIIWGSQAIGGVVNLVSRRPEGPLAIDSQLEYGYADTVSGSANISGKAGIFEASAGGSYFRTDGISFLDGAPGAEKDGSRIYALNGRLKANLTDTFSLDFRGYFNDTVLHYDSPFSGGANSLSIAYGKQFVAYVGANLELADSRFHNRVAYTRTDQNRRGTDPVVFSFNNYQAKGTIDRFEYRGAYDLADIATLAAGAEHEKISSYSQFETLAADTAKNDLTSGYAQLSLRPLSGLTVTGGIRYDDYTDYGGHTSLGGNVAYTPNDGATVFRATYGEGFRAPTLTEAQPPFGNINLKPEVARNLDVGVEQKLLGDRIQLGATYFRRRTDNQIAFSTVTFQSENIEKVHTDGVEVWLIAKPTDSLEIQGNYTLTDARNRSGANFGKRLQLRPKHAGSATVDWTSPFGLKLGGTVTVAGDSFNDAANLTKIKGYTVVDVRAAYPITDTVELYGRVENVFDKDYTVITGYGTYGRAAYGGVRLKF